MLVWCGRQNSASSSSSSSFLFQPRLRRGHYYLLPLGLSFLLLLLLLPTMTPAFLLPSLNSARMLRHSVSSWLRRSSATPKSRPFLAPSSVSLYSSSCSSSESNSNSYNPLFDDVPDRRNTSSLKWSKYGQEILPLWVADMDFRAPQCVIDAMHARAEHGVYGYSVPKEEVTMEVVKYLKRTAHYQIEPDWIVWSHGLVPALTVAARMAGGPGDSVMTNTPIYPPFLWTPKTADMSTLQVSLKFEGGREGGQWRMDFAKMEEMVTPTTKMFTLCNPHNPVGKVFTIEELRQLGDFCKRHDLILLSDEIYHDLILDPILTPHVPIAALEDPELMKRTIILHAASKTYNVPGLSCAYAIIPDLALRTRFKKAAMGFVTEINAFGYESLYASYTGGESWRQSMLSYLKSNRDFLHHFFSTRLPLLKPYPNHDATYLLWVDTSALAPYLKQGEEAAEFFMREAKVAVSDGRDFGAKHHVRINFGCPRARLLEGLEKMEKAVNELVAAKEKEEGK